MLKTTTAVRIFLLLLAFLPTAAPPTSAEQTAGAVIVEDANLRSSPSETAQIIIPLRKDTRVLLGARDKGWVRIEAPPLAESGWVHSSLVREIADEQVVQPNRQKTIGPEQQKINRAHTPGKKAHAQPAQVTAVIDIQQVIDQSLRGREAGKRFVEMRQAGQSEQLDKIEKEMLGHVVTEIQSVVEQYALEKGFTQVLNRNSGCVFYSDPQFDITGDIIREYDRRISLPNPEP